MRKDGSMLKIKNAAGEELLTLNDDGTEKFSNQKLEEEYKQAEEKVDNKGE